MTNKKWKKKKRRMKLKNETTSGRKDKMEHNKE